MKPATEWVSLPARSGDANNMLTGRRHPCCGHLPSAMAGAGGVGRRGGEELPPPAQDNLLPLDVAGKGAAIWGIWNLWTI